MTRQEDDGAPERTVVQRHECRRSLLERLSISGMWAPASGPELPAALLEVISLHRLVQFAEIIDRAEQLLLDLNDALRRPKFATRTS